MKWLQKEGTCGKNVPVLLLLAVGMIEFLFITLESRFSGIGYYLAENYLIVPCLLFLGYSLREKVTAFARRRLLLAVAAVAWFVIVQMQHTLSGMESHPMATVFFVYLMAFPFASLADDRSNTGIRWIGGMFVAASLVLVGYSLLLLAGWVPSGMQDVLFWDGARLHVLWHPNITACYLLIGIGFTAAFCVQAEKLWVKALLLAAVAAQFLVMSLTNCRTILLMTGALFGGIAFFRIFRGSWKRALPGLLAAVVLLVGSFKLSGMLFQWNNDRLVAARNYISEESAAEETDFVTVEETPAEAMMIPEEATPLSAGIIEGDNPQGTLADDMRTLNGRTIIWRSALNAIRDNGSLALWGTAYPGTVISVYNPWEVVHSHNSWMEVLLRMGWPGLLLSLVFTAVSLWSAAKLILQKKADMWKKIIAMTTMCVLVAGFLEPYLFITNVYYHIIDFVFFFCTGYLDYWCSARREQETETAK